MRVSSDIIKRISNVNMYNAKSLVVRMVRWSFKTGNYTCFLFVQLDLTFWTRFCRWHEGTCWGLSLFLACTNIWVPGNGFSMLRFVHAFAAPVPAQATQFIVLYSHHQHIRSSVLAQATRAQFCTYTNITHM